MYDTYIFSKASFNKVLNEYNEAVKKGFYRKEVPYQEWRKLKEADEVIVTISDSIEIDTISSSVDTISDSIEVDERDYDNDDYTNRFVIISVDNDVIWNKETSYNRDSFGDFLYYKGYQYCDKHTYEVSYLSYSDSTVGQITGTIPNLTTTITASSICDNLENKVNEAIKKAFEEKNEEEEKENNMKGFKFDFGPCTGDNIRMSMFGLAIKNNSDTWVSYNSQTGEIIDVDILNFDGRKFMYKIPVALKDISIGDMIIHNRTPMFVLQNSIENKELVAIDVMHGEKKIVIPTVNMFGFNFVTKVVSLMDNFNTTPTENSPFGNMLPLLMMGDNKDFDSNTMMMLMMMNQGSMNMFQNPMMMYLMMKDNGENNDTLPMMMAMMTMNNNSPIQKIHKENEEEFIKSNTAKTQD